MDPQRVVVLGGGVNGLTCALQLLRAGYDDVVVWAEARGMAPPNWVWEYPPYHVEPEEAALRWARVTFDAFVQLTAVPESHCHMIPVLVLGKDKLPPNPGKEFLPAFMEGSNALEEAHRLLWAEYPTARKYTDANHYLAPVCNSVKYLAYLQTQIIALGGQVKERTVESIDLAIATATAPATTPTPTPTAASNQAGLTDASTGRRRGGAPTRTVIVNCTGLGSKTIVPDPAMYPQRGDLVHVDAPWVKCAAFDDGYGGKTPAAMRIQPWTARGWFAHMSS
jgi:D-amino-acid oxidase